jgi:hypothetical protein
MAENIKLTLEVDKDLVKGMLAMGGGLKDNTPSSIVKEWINEHDSVELPASVISDTPELGVAMATIVLLGISKELKKDKEK